MTGAGFLVVARFANGDLVRGRTADFRVGREFFHVLEEGAAERVRVAVRDLKALFYVKSLRGDRSHEERKTFRHRKGVGMKVWVEFLDGEELAGWTVSYTPEKGGFFLFPTDANSNAKKVFVCQGAVRRVFQGEEAERAALEYERKRRPPRAPRPAPDSWDDLLGEDPPHPGSKRPSLPVDEGGSRRRKDTSDFFLGDW